MQKRFGDIHSRRFVEGDYKKKGLVLGEEYFFLAGSDAAILIIVEERSPTETKVEAISYAGGKGLTSVSYGAHSDYAHEVKMSLTNSGFETPVEEEISYFDCTKSPSST